MEELQIIEAIEKALISPKKLSTIIEKHMLHTVKFFIINKVLSHQFNQQELDYMIERGKTAAGIAEFFEEIIILAVENSFNNKSLQ